jgi:hypothetical protein
VSNNNGGSVDYAQFRATKDSNGTYFLEWKLRIGGASSNSAHSVTLGLGTTWAFSPLIQTGYSNEGHVNTYVHMVGGQARLDIGYESAKDTFTIGGSGVLAGKPSWFDANREAGFSINAQVEEGTPTTAGILKSNLTKTKASTGGDHTSSGTISGLTFNNLKIGTTYSFSFKPFVVDTAVNNDVLSADVKNGATIVGSWQYRSDVESNGRYQWTLTGEFTATATTVTVDYNASATHYFAAGSTLLTLTELNNTADAGTAWD